MPPKRVHLVCNAHLDLVWQWPWEDGWAEALSTFRVAADFCERERGFVFCHNEMLLYRWVEEYEPQLFTRIKQLVEAGSWKISGGAYLQPDVNGPHGESHIRHYLLARPYFERHFGTYPKTAYNFDPFGHPEGFPQILAGCGMEHYVHCRPARSSWELPVGNYRWRDRSGAEVIGRRDDEHYPTWDNVDQKLETFLAHYAEEAETMILWGLGNHGGGPSRSELRQIKAFAQAHPEFDIIHSSPDDFFAASLKRVPRKALPLVQGEIQNCALGCLVSMSRVKRAHRVTEGLLLATERLAALAWWHGLAPYPQQDLAVAWRDLLFAQFHDSLPGSGAPSVERDSLQLLAHAAEDLRRARLRVLHAVIKAEPAAQEGAVPVFIANPHGFPVKTQVEVDLQLAPINRWCHAPAITLECDGQIVPSQGLHHDAVCADAMKRLAVAVDLAPFEVQRLDERFVPNRGTTPCLPLATARTLTFANRAFTLKIDPATGLIASLTRRGSRQSLVAAGAFAPVLFEDMDHSWRCGTPHPRDLTWRLDQGGFTRRAQAFHLATPREAFDLDPTFEQKYERAGKVATALRISEDGPLRTVVEALLVCGSTAVVRRYVVRHREGELEIRDRVCMNHRDHMLKLDVPLAFTVKDAVAEAVYSAVTREPTADHSEHPNQRWVAVRGTQAGKAVHLAVVNDGSYGHAFTDNGHLWLDCLRTPAYASFNTFPEREWRGQVFRPRMDIGEHELRWQIVVGGRFNEPCMRRSAEVFNQPPTFLVYYPQPVKVDRKRRRLFADSVTVDDEAVQVVAVKRAENGRELVVRLLETAGKARTVHLRVTPRRQAIPVAVGAYGLASVAIRRGGTSLKWRRVDLVERTVR